MYLQRPEYTPAYVTGLELAVFGAERNAGAPIIIMTHSLGGAASLIYPYCVDLANAGYLAIAVEQRNHGRRVVNTAHHNDDDPEVGAHVYGIIVGTSVDISLLIDFLPAHLGIDVDRVGLTGISLGGHVTLMTMARDPRIKVGVSLLGSPAEEENSTWSPELFEVAQRYDSLYHPEAFADRPLLMLTGAEDTRVPGDRCERLADRARPHYTDPSRLKHHNFEGVGHGVPPEMWDETRNWFLRWLPPE